MHFRLASMAIVVALAATTPASAQFGGLGRNKDKDKEAALKEKEEKRDSKNQRIYDKVKAYAQNKYDTDPDFRDEVEEGYSNLLRDHKEIAWTHNINRGSKIYAVHEDRFRLHEQLYDNLLVQDHINRIGQSLVPPDSDRTFAFRLLPDPTPSALTLATGTIYISTGMVSMLDSEAQLAYVLAHEMSHVQMDHWKQKVLMEKGLEAYNNDQSKKTERISMIGGIAGGLLGGIATKSVVAGLASAGGGALAAGLLSEYALNRKAVLEWDRVQEDEADKMAFKAMLERRYDVREVPKLYLAMETMVSRDRRMTLGFLGDRNRVKQRKENSDKLITDAYKAEVELALQKGFIGDSAAHRNLMAELKRDNGIMAYYTDMFAVARKNLAEAVAIRENDAAAQYFYGKTLKLIGRTEEDQKLAVQCFLKATQYDTLRENFGAHLHYALSMIEDSANPDRKLITNELDSYVTDYARYQVEYQKTLLLPPNMDTMYEYMMLYGDVNWKPKLPAEAEMIRAVNLPTAPVVNPASASTPAPVGVKNNSPARPNVKQIMKQAAPVVPRNPITPVITPQQ